MPRLPQVSGARLLRMLESLGYEVQRQRGSHVQLQKITSIGKHSVTVPNHNPIAKGTLNDIISKVSLWNGIPKNELLDQMRTRQR